MDRSQYRDKLLHPLRKEITKFTEFYVNSKQIVTTSLDKAESAKVDVSGMQIEINHNEAEGELPF